MKKDIYNNPSSSAVNTQEGQNLDVTPMVLEDNVDDDPKMKNSVLSISSTVTATPASGVSLPKDKTPRQWM